jgi:glutathione S-transferase
MSFVLFGNANWTSPYVLSCFVTLREKQVAFDVKSISLHDGAQHEATFARQSLTSRVPTLLDADFALSESSAIVEYLEEAFPAPAHASVFPSDVRHRARARQVMAWIRSDLVALREERSSARRSTYFIRTLISIR